MFQGINSFFYCSLKEDKDFNGRYHLILLGVNAAYCDFDSYNMVIMMMKNYRLDHEILFSNPGNLYEVGQQKPNIL